jgi:spore coat polysaccharide biosynthesis predicted glycosyltransferase SpsG
MSRHKLTVALDTAGGRRQGIGHLLRSIALAEELRSQRAEVRLVSLPKSLPALAARALRSSRLDSTRVNGAPRPAIVVVDRPDTTPERLRGLRRRWPASPLAALDYYGAPVDGVRLVVNLNDARRRGAPSTVVACHQGLQFAILRASFRRHRRTRRGVRARVRRILVGFGGTDVTGWSTQAADLLARSTPKDVMIDVLSGAAGRAVPAEPRVRQHLALSDPAALLAAADVAVIGGGTMLIEVACLGVPAVVVPRTREETLFARQFVRAGAACAVGEEGSFPSEAVERQVRRLLRDRRARARMRRAGRRLVDGQGAARVARLVLQTARKPV